MVIETDLDLGIYLEIYLVTHLASYLVSYLVIHLASYLVNWKDFLKVNQMDSPMH